MSKRISGHRSLILDGAMGTELQSRGVPMDDLMWSASALETDLKVVRQIHEDYIRSGADVIITNTFATSRSVLTAAGKANRFRDFNQSAVEVALEARKASGREQQVLVAGSISSFFAGLVKDMKPNHTRMATDYHEQAMLLAESGVDLIVLEMMLTAEQANAGINAAVAVKLPVWVGFSCRTGTSSRDMLMLERPGNSTFDTVLSRTNLSPAEAVFVMHTDVADVPDALKIVKKHWKGPLGAYAHSGDFVMPNWIFRDTISPEDYATASGYWSGLGCIAIGGGCGTTPDHIQALKIELSHLK